MRVPHFLNRFLGGSAVKASSPIPEAETTTPPGATTPTHHCSLDALFSNPNAVAAALNQVQDEAGFSGVVSRVSEVIRKLQAKGLDVDEIYHSDLTQFQNHKGPVVILIPEAHDYIDNADLKHKQLKYETLKALCENDKLKITRFAKEGFQGINETKLQEVEGMDVTDLMPNKEYNVPFLIAHTFRKDLNFVPTEDYSSIFEGFILRMIIGMFNHAYFADPKSVPDLRTKTQQTLTYFLDKTTPGYENRCLQYNGYITQLFKTLNLNNDCVLEDIGKDGHTILFPRMVSTDKLQITGTPGHYNVTGKLSNALMYVYSKDKVSLLERNSDIARRSVEGANGIVPLIVGANHAATLTYYDYEQVNQVPVIVIRAGTHDSKLNDYIRTLVTSDKAAALNTRQAALHKFNEWQNDFPDVPDKSMLIAKDANI